MLRRLERVAVALALLVGASVFAADSVVKQINARLEPFKTLHARFTEEKRVEGLTKPLKSTGRIAYERTRGLLWLVEKPLASQTVMTPTSVIQKVKGRTTVSLNVTAQPSIRSSRGSFSLR